MKIPTRLAHRVIEGQAFILDPKDKLLHRLSPSASVIWQALLKGRSVEQAAHDLAEEFEVSHETAARDAAEFIAQLEAKGLLEKA